MSYHISCHIFIISLSCLDSIILMSLICKTQFCPKFESTIWLIPFEIHLTVNNLLFCFIILGINSTLEDWRTFLTQTLTGALAAPHDLFRKVCGDWCASHWQITCIILLYEKFLQFDWLRAVVIQLNLKYLHVKITNLVWVVV